MSNQQRVLLKFLKLDHEVAQKKKTHTHTHPYGISSFSEISQKIKECDVLDFHGNA